MLKKQLYVSKFKRFGKVDQLLERHTLPKLTTEGIDKDSSDNLISIKENTFVV